MKTPGVGGNRGYDGGKKVNGRKRHLLVDPQGLVLKVHSAAVMDRDGVALLLPPEQTKQLFPRLEHVWLDGGYKGEGQGQAWIEKLSGWRAEIVQHPPKIKGVWVASGEKVDWFKLLSPPGFRVLPRRCRANILMVMSEPKNEQRLRAKRRDQCGDDLSRSHLINTPC